MATSLHFKQSTRNLAAAVERAGVSLDVYALLNITDHLITAGVNFAEHAPAPTVTDHDRLVQMVLVVPEVMQNLRDSRKIVAIKEVRRLSGCSLKAAKDAVEDDLVSISVNLMSDPWAVPVDPEEPPF